MQTLAVLIGRSRCWNDNLQITLLNENNQPNVTFILELMIGGTIEPNRLLQLLTEVSFFDWLLN